MEGLNPGPPDKNTSDLNQSATLPNPNLENVEHPAITDLVKPCCLAGFSQKLHQGRQQLIHQGNQIPHQDSAREARV